jgi:hypothetical protein
MTLDATDIRSWLQEHATADLSRSLATPNGQRTFQQLLQRQLCSIAQHTRQLIEIIERLGLEPEAQLTDDDLEGLVMATGIWQ